MSYISDGILLSFGLSLLVTGIGPLISHPTFKMMVAITALNAVFVRYLKSQINTISVNQIVFNCKTQAFDVIRLSGKKITILPRNLEIQTDDPKVMYYCRESREELATIDLGDWCNEDFFLGVV